MAIRPVDSWEVSERTEDRWRRLSEGLFPPDTATPASRRRRLGAFFLVFLGAALLLLRQPGVSALDSLYSEDGAIFLHQARTLSPLLAVVHPYAGYLHLAPRLLAEPAALLPLRYAAAYFAAAAALSLAALGFLVSKASASHFKSWTVPAMLGCSLVLLPVAQGEAFNNVANLHWFLVYVGFWLLLWRPIRSWELAVSCVILVLVPLSDPLAFVLAPLAVFRVLVVRDWRQQIPTAVFGAALIAQTVVTLQYRDDRVLVGQVAPGNLSLSISPIRTAAHYMFRVTTTGLFGGRWLEASSTVVARLFTILSLAALVCIVTICVKRRRTINLPLVAASGLSSILLFSLAESLLAGTVPPRYTIVPVLLLYVVIGCLADDRLTSDITRPGRLAVIWVLAFASIVWAGNLRVENVRSQGPSWGAGLRQAQAECMAANNSGHVTVRIYPPGSLELACVDLAPQQHKGRSAR